MFCTAYKWLISQAADSEKPVSRLVKNHTRRCDSCRAFAQHCESLKPKFAQDKLALFENADRALDKKILSALAEESVSVSERHMASRIFVSRRPALVPSLAAALFVLAISLSLIFIVIPHSKKADSFGRPSEWVSAASPPELLAKAKSPLEREYQELKKTFNSTTEYLRSALDFHIGKQTD
jgi:hypothetical protein